MPFSTWESALWGFVVFRIFRRVQTLAHSLGDRRVAGGFGILIDYVMAGIYALEHNASVVLAALTVQKRRPLARLAQGRCHAQRNV